MLARSRACDRFRGVKSVSPSRFQCEIITPTERPEKARPIRGVESLHYVIIKVLVSSMF